MPCGADCSLIGIMSLFVGLEVGFSYVVIVGQNHCRRPNNKIAFIVHCAADQVTGVVSRTLFIFLESLYSTYHCNDGMPELPKAGMVALSLEKLKAAASGALQGCAWHALLASKAPNSSADDLVLHAQWRRTSRELIPKLNIHGGTEGMIRSRQVGNYAGDALLQPSIGYIFELQDGHA